MHRIDTPTAQQDKFGQGKNGFTNGDPATGRLATHVNSDIRDALQEEICTVIERAGIRLDKSQHEQLYQAVRKVSEDEANKAKMALTDGISLECNTLNKLYQALRTFTDTSVHQAKTALIDGAPSTLNTLNKLYQVLRAFIDTTVHQTKTALIDGASLESSTLNRLSHTLTKQLNQKLSKHENGADIPNKSLFLKNIHLSETINLAKNATPSHRKINGKPLTQDVRLTASDVQAVTPDTLRIEVPVGVPLPWPKETPPSGWLKCNGQAFDKNRYPLLAQAYPSGRTPDLRGLFIRGLDENRQIDPHRSLLTFQDDAIRNITGRFGYVRQGPYAPPVLADGAFSIDSNYSANIRIGESDNWGSVSSFNASRVVPTADENRPKNIAFSYIVRAA